MFNEITPPQLMRLLGLANAPHLIDVTTDEDLASLPCLIPTAQRHPSRQIAELIPQLSGQRVVVICQKGKKLSHGTAARLRADGIAAEVLAGGKMAWHAAGLPHVPIKSLPDSAEGTPEGPTLWVTRHRPKIDRIARPWLSRRLVDCNARFLFVPPTQMPDIADRFGTPPLTSKACFGPTATPSAPLTQ